MPGFDRKEYCLLVQAAYKANNDVGGDMSVVMRTFHKSIVEPKKYRKMFGHLYYAARQYNRWRVDGKQRIGSVNERDIDIIGRELIKRQSK